MVWKSKRVCEPIRIFALLLFEFLLLCISTITQSELKQIIWINKLTVQVFALIFPFLVEKTMWSELRMRAVWYSSSLCDNIKLWAKSSLVLKVCFSDRRSVEVKQAPSKEILESLRRRAVEGQEAGESCKMVFKDLDWRGEIWVLQF